jgi:hypothetical protein
MVEAEWVSQPRPDQCKRGLFTLSDRSTNGTYVKFGDDEGCACTATVHLRRSGISASARPSP